MTLETDFHIQGFGATAKDVQQITMTNQVTSHDGPISELDMYSVVNDAFMVDLEGETHLRLEFNDSNNSRMTIRNTDDDWATESVAD